MFQISKNRYFDALLKLLLFSAAVHMVILIGYAFITGNFGVLNFFNILDIEFIIPEIIEGTAMNVVAFIAAVSAYIAILFFYTKKTS